MTLTSKRMTALSVGTVVGFAAVSKLLNAEDTASDWTKIGTEVGLAFSHETMVAVVLAFSGLEVLGALMIALRSRYRAIAGWGLMIAIFVGTVFFGLASHWGRSSRVSCGCGLPSLPFFGSDYFAAVALRSAILMGLMGISDVFGSETGDVATGNDADESPSPPRGDRSSVKSETSAQ